MSSLYLSSGERYVISHLVLPGLLCNMRGIIFAYHLLHLTYFIHLDARELIG
jgi:hypothetical protein